MNRNPFGRSQCSDQMLLSKLDASAALTKQERAAVVYAMGRFVERGSLPKALRDQLSGIARAHKLLAKTAFPKNPTPQSINLGDSYSTRPGAIRPECLVRPARPPQRKAG